MSLRSIRPTLTPPLQRLQTALSSRDQELLRTPWYMVRAPTSSR
jgi:hypothetical protein